MREARSLVAIAAREDEFESESDKRRQINGFKDQIEFIQTALDYSEEKMDAVKVKDLETLTSEAKDKITVGKMKILVGPKKGEKGVVKGVLRGLAFILGL